MVELEYLGGKGDYQGSCCYDYIQFLVVVGEGDQYVDVQKGVIGCCFQEGMLGNFQVWQGCGEGQVVQVDYYQIGNFQVNY